MKFSLPTFDMKCFAFLSIKDVHFCFQTIMKLQRRPKYIPCMASGCTCSWLSDYYLNFLATLEVLSSRCLHNFHEKRPSLVSDTSRLREYIISACGCLLHSCFNFSSSTLTKTSTPSFFFLYEQARHFYRIASLNSVIRSACRLKQPKTAWGRKPSGFDIFLLFHNLSAANSICP